MRGALFRPGPWLALGVSLLVAPGCRPLTSAFVYTCDRVVDAADMVDFGISVTPRFSLSAYACLLGMGGVGAGSVNGYFTGIGGSRVGIFRHYHSNIGVVLYSYEVNAWGDFDLNDRETLTRRHRGLISWIFLPTDGQCRGPT